MIIVGVRNNIALPWICVSKPTYTQISYKLNPVHLKESEDFEGRKDYVDVFELQICSTCYCKNNIHATMFSSYINNEQTKPYLHLGPCV